MTKNYDMVKHFSKEERAQYYTAMHKFWKSVCDKYPNARNLSMAGRFNIPKETEQ